ncbi:hypothetical protein P154DRAFT_39620 [Amniculicola lignicola CBS 123094]|uniref:Uncharacterized protein n=1 Tax=Amniculicola lignicola CBS 123094 TaxID=1392246 RepID=A0A6A5VZL4_9PLEO|nr:hypothetical protein P154DRAFT_39620 [Amniculicola lignicola CBS 123094]
MTEQLLEALVNLSEIRPRPPHPISSFGCYIGPLNPSDPRLFHLIDHCWQATGTIRERFQVIRRKISDHLQSCPGTSTQDCRVIISLYMIGRTPQTAAPTVLLISKDADY